MTAPQTVLVTGSAGFIGRHVARRYASLGCDVAGLGHDASGSLSAPDLHLSRWRNASVTDAELRSLDARPDIVVHCAGDSLVATSFSEPENMVRRNVEAAKAVLDFARTQPRPPRVLMLSSAAVYGVASALPIAEDAPVQPISPYGRGKAAMEELCQSYGRQHGVAVVLLRLFSVYGRGLRKQLFWDACRKFAAGESEFGGTGHERRDWLHVDDAVSLILRAADHASPDVLTLNGGSGASITVADALTRLRAAWNRPLPALSFTGVARAGDPPGYEAGIARAIGLGWKPQRCFEDGIADYAVWAREVLT